jgi:hypothetical protein
VFPNNDGCVGCACSGLGVGLPAPKIEFPGFQVVKTCESELIQHTSVGKTRHRKCDRLLLFFGRIQGFCRYWERLKNLNSDKTKYALAFLLRTYEGWSVLVSVQVEIGVSCLVASSEQNTTPASKTSCLPLSFNLENKICLTSAAANANPPAHTISPSFERTSLWVFL